MKKLKIDKIELKTIYTPGHTDCSYSFIMNDKVFTGDTLLINDINKSSEQVELIFKMEAQKLNMIHYLINY